MIVYLLLSYGHIIFFFFTNYNQPYKGLVAKVVHFFFFFGGIGFSVYSYIYKHNYNKCLIVEYLVSHANIIIINYYINNYHIYIYIYIFCKSTIIYEGERTNYTILKLFHALHIQTIVYIQI